MNRKVHAFTLIELLIALVISSITMLVVFYAYEIVLRQSKNYRLTNNKLQEAAQVNALLNYDFDAAKKITVNGNSVEVLFNDQTVRQYLLFDDYIIRKRAGENDTLFLKVKAPDIILKFNNSPAIKNNIVDELIIPVTILTQQETFHFKKTYSASDLIEAEELALDLSLIHERN